MQDSTHRRRRPDCCRPPELPLCWPCLRPGRLDLAPFTEFVEGSSSAFRDLCRSGHKGFLLARQAHSGHLSMLVFRLTARAEAFSTSRIATAAAHQASNVLSGPAARTVAPAARRKHLMARRAKARPPSRGLLFRCAFLGRFLFGLFSLFRLGPRDAFLLRSRNVFRVAGVPRLRRPGRDVHVGFALFDHVRRRRLADVHHRP